jgi:ribosomal-protein-alanine N-acetyltransferase
VRVSGRSDHLWGISVDPLVMKYIGEGVRTKDKVQEFLNLAIHHQAKHGFTFCSVFEKESNNFIGQAGLIHLACDDSQPDVEVPLFQESCRL